jgi:heme/copper-type cytochrome/quinol oxidase subunit 1
MNLASLDLMLFAFHFAGLSSILSSINVISTILSCLYNSNSLNFIGLFP